MLRALDIQFFEPYSQILDVSQGIEFPKWCVGGKMNIVHNCLDKYMGTARENQSVLSWRAKRVRLVAGAYLRGQLYCEANKVANGLRGLG